MKKLVTGLILGLACWAVAAASLAETKYAVCVGINEYKEISSLEGCVNDANHFYTNLVARGGWLPGNMTKLTDSKATKDAIRKAISNYAAKAVSGDTFVYNHSSHGGQISGTDTYLCVYDEVYEDDSTAYNDWEVAADLQKFAAGVKVVVIVDACHSGGLFRDAQAREAANADLAANWDFAGRVSTIMEENRAARLARGERGVEKTLAASEIGWVTAAKYSESSYDGGYYADNQQGGVFMCAGTEGWMSGAADTQYGDGDGYENAYEFWAYAYPICTKGSHSGYESYSKFFPQHTNDTVLKSVDLGWAGDEEPGGLRFAAVPAQVATVGQAMSYGLVVSNIDGSSGAIAVSVSASDAPAGSYSLSGKTFTFTPPADRTYSFTFLATNATAKTWGKASMTVNATLAAPQNLANSAVSGTGFTANWDAVTGASSYLFDLSAESWGARAAKDGNVILGEDFAGFTAESADVSTKLDSYTAVAGWSGEKVFSQLGVCKLGSSSYSGWLATPTLDLSNGGVLSFKLTRYNTDKGSLKVSVSEDDGNNWTTVVTLEPVSGGQTEEVELPASGTAAKVMFETTANRAYLDDIVITSGGGSTILNGVEVSGTSYTVDDLEAGTYYWRVRAKGNANGAYSSEMSVTLVMDPTSVPVVSPVEAVEATCGEVLEIALVAHSPDEGGTVSWALTEGADAGTIDANGVFTLTATKPGTYSFTAVASNSNGDSDPVSFSVTLDLAAVEALEPTSIGSDDFTAAWNAVDGADSYELLVVEGQSSVSPGPAAATDTLTADLFTASGSSYEAFSGVSGGHTAVYAGVTANHDGAIQLRIKNSEEGIVSTTSGGNVSTVRVVWNTDTSAGRVLDIYGSTTAYSAASDLYSETTAGKLLGSLAFDDNQTTVEVSGSYPYVGIRAKSGALYLDSIEIDWADGSKSIRAVGDVVFSNNVGNVTNYVVDGLQPLTEYTYAVRAISDDVAGEWSEAVSVQTADGPSAPSWGTIPAQQAVIDSDWSLDLAAYVSGTPTPALSVVSGGATLSGTVLSYATGSEEGTVEFVVKAANSEGETDVTITLNVLAELPAVKYALCVGINKYVDITPLTGCVNDADYMYANLIERGDWSAANMTKLTDSQATKNGIRTAISNIAAVAKAGDTFVYQHSSHGGNEDEDNPTRNVFLCVYDEDFYDNSTAYNDYELAADLQAFPAGVKVVVIVDACFSGGLFKGARTTAKAWDLAGSVSAIIDADRAARAARGDKSVAKTLSASEIGWVTAAEYSETSLDGGFYHTSEWLTNAEYGEEYWNESTEEYNYPDSYIIGGVFLCSGTRGWVDGTADTTGVGDNDSYCDGYEFWKFGYDFCSQVGTFWGNSEANFTPQYTNEAVLRSVELGWVGETPPTGVHVIAGNAEIVVGETAEIAVTAENYDGSDGEIVLSVTSGPEDTATWSFANGTLSFTPTADGTYKFVIEGVNASAGTDGHATATITATLATPVATDATQVTTSGFTANWEAVPGATGYHLQVALAGELASTSGYELITTDGQLEAGDYVITGCAADDDTAQYAMLGEVSTSKTKYLVSGSTAEDIVGGVIAEADASKVWTLAQDATLGGWTIYNDAVGYAMCEGAQNSANAETTATAKSTWSITAADGLFKLENKNTTGRFLQYNSGAPRFACYTGSQRNVRLYKATGGALVVDMVVEGGDTTSYAVAGLNAGTYAYQVAAIGTLGETEASNQVEVTIDEDPSAVPVIAPVENVTAMAGEAVSFALTCSSPASAGVVGWTLTAGSDNGSIADGVFTLSATEAGEYSFTVVASNTNGDSEPVSFTVTLTAAPVTVPELTLSNPTANSFKAEWTACTDVSSYTLQVSTAEFKGIRDSDAILSENFTQCDASDTNGGDITSKLDQYTGTIGWTGSKVFEAAGRVKLGSSSAIGYIVTPAVNIPAGAVLTCKIAKYGTDTGTVDIQLSANGGEFASLLAEAIAPVVDGDTYTVNFAEAVSSAKIKFISSAKRFYLDDVVISGSGGGSSVLSFTVEGTSKIVDGLEPETTYYARVKGEADWSEVKSIETAADVPSAPVWSEIPPQTVAAGQELVIDLTAYVSGSPKPTITADAGTVENGVLTVSFADADDYTINLTAENSEGSVSATLAVTVTDAPVTVPVLTLSNPTDTTFDAEWTACTGATSYQFQVATAPEFKAARAGDAILSEDFAKCTTANGSDISSKLDEYTETAGWTGVKVFEDDGRVKLGSSSAAGSLVTPAVDIPAGAAFSFKIAKYGSDTGTVDVQISVDGGEFESLFESPITPVADGETYETEFDEAVASAQIKFITSAKRAYVDDVVLSGEGGGGSGSAIVIDETTSDLSCTVEGLEPDTTYYARVRMAEGEWSAVESITTTGEGPAGPAKYAVCVGLSEYDMAAFAEMGLEVTPLKGCVNDATYLKKNLTERGGWAEGNVSLLTNGSATKSAIRGAIAAAAAKAKAGDTFVYEHSSHGLQGDEEDDYTVALATYDSLYEDAELAEDLASFADGVKVVVLVDACHSGGLFDDGADAGPDGKARSAASFDIAARVSALIDANRAARKARGEDVARTLASDQIGWVTAAAYEETSKDGGYYDTDAWMSDDEADGEERGGAFLAALAWGWWSGKADVSGEGDGDGWFDAYEGWAFSTPVCAEYDQTPQYLNEDVLRAVELGWVGDAAPSDAIVFDPVPGAEVSIGEEATLTVVAKNADGTTDGITLSIAATDPEDLEYTFVDGTLAFTPAEDGIFLFTVQAVKGRLSTTKILGVTAVLSAPVAQEATDIAEDGFTANWLGVDAARNYQIQVSTDPDFPMGEPEKLVEEGFDEVTNTVSSLPDGWEFTGTFGIYATGGEAAPSIKLSTDKAVLTTPSFELNGGENGLAFWTKGNPGSGNVLTSTLTVQQLVGDEWKELAAPFVPSKDGETKEIEGLDPEATRIRFVMAKTSGNIAIDDVVVAQANGGPVVDDDEIPAGSTSYAVEDLEPGTTYYYRVRAIANTKSAWSDVIEVATAGEKPIPVPDLTVMAPETSADTSLAAFWVCTGAEEFRLQVATDEAFASLVFDETMTEIAMTVTGLTPETTYYVRVCALDGERAGDWSNVESLATAASGGDVPVQADIEAVTIDGTARTMKFAVSADAMVMTTTNLVTGPWVAYDGDVDGEGNVVIPLTGTAAFFRLGEPPAGD